MQQIFRSIIIGALALTMSASAFAASIELRLKDGTRWRGEVGDTVSLSVLEQGVSVPFEGKIVQAADLYLVVEGRQAGQMQKKTIFRGDIVAIKTIGAPGSGAPASSTLSDDAASLDGKIVESGMPPGCWKDPAIKNSDGSMRWVAPKPGVFVLPMEGGVGEDIRYNEVEMLGKYADKFGPGQIIILIIDTNGGSVAEIERIDETIQEVQKRHRVIAWIRKAISAGCAISMACQEIYFMTEGTAGSVTTVMGTVSMKEGPELTKHIEALVATCVRNGHSEHIARAMKLNKYLCSYTKDPVTGEVKFFGDLSGQVILSDEKSNLCFNSSNALDCGFSDGTADTTAQLAKLLNIPEWYEISDYGRKSAKQWTDTAERARTDIRLLAERINFKGAGSGDIVVVLGNQIQLLKDAINWWKRAPNVARSMLPPVEQLEREVEELKKQLADIQRARRGG